MVSFPLAPERGARLLLLAMRMLGGQGSGNFGHAGRPGERGGSGEGGGSRSSEWFSNLDKISGPKGSNPGGVYKDSTGQKWYVKQYSDARQAASEHVSNEIYHAVGVTASQSVMGPKGEFASKWIDDAGGTLGDTGVTKQNANAVLDGFAADVFVANWDAVGTGHDNILVKGDMVRRVDQGGTLLFRAQGGLKPESGLKKIGEWDTLSDSSINPYYAKVFKVAGVKNADALGGRVVKQIERIRDARPRDGWEGFVKRAVPHAGEEFHKRIGEMLEARQKGLEKKADALRLKAAAVVERMLGGPGSGNFGHSGRPGERGGSSSEGSTSNWVRNSPSGVEQVDMMAPIPRNMKPDSYAHGFVQLYHVTSIDSAKAIDREGFKAGTPNQFQGFESAHEGTYGWASLDRARLEVQRMEENSPGSKEDFAIVHFQVPMSAWSRLRGDEDTSFESEWKKSYKSGMSAAILGDVPAAWIKGHYVDQSIKTLGGPGSGNFGHAGCPGEVGGSCDSEGGNAEIKVKKKGPKAPPVPMELKHKAYEMIKSGKTFKAVAAELGMTHGQVAGHVWKVDQKKKAAEEALKAGTTTPGVTTPEVTTPVSEPKTWSSMSPEEKVGLATEQGYTWKAKTFGPKTGEFAWFDQSGVQVSSPFKEKTSHREGLDTLHMGKGLTPPTPVTPTEGWPISNDTPRSLGSTYPKVVEQAAKKWVSGLSSDEKDAIRGYTGSNYLSINSVLRGEMKGDDWHQRDIKSISKALEKAPKPPPPELVWRGIEAHHSAVAAKFTTTGTKKFIDSLGSGDEIELEGFLSTSIKPEFAPGWSGHKTVFEIKPAKGAYIRNLSHHSQEYEFLLPHAARYTVKGITQVKLGGHKAKVIQLEMHP